jgi:sulfur transfer complex TusBCD TusB component (DsrH family)
MMNEGKILSYVWENAVLCVLKYNRFQLMHSVDVQVVMQPDVIAR